MHLAGSRALCIHQRTACMRPKQQTTSEVLYGVAAFAPLFYIRGAAIADSAVGNYFAGFVLGGVLLELAFAYCAGDF